ncbi:MAG: hypothetical protein WCI77_03805 [Candidatus Omnitrophota bacterium]
MVRDIQRTIAVLSNTHTHLSPSHVGHPGYGDLAFLYDKAVDALVLKAGGYQKEAQAILDYFAARLKIPFEEIRMHADTNDTYGIIKIFSPFSASGMPTKALMNALDITSNRRQGKATLEFFTTPGPTSFLIFAFLQVNPDIYKNEALLLGEVLLAMQNADGGIRDGDRSPEKVHTEPHMDSYAAFMMLYQISGDSKWEIAAHRALEWFNANVYHPNEAAIDQGVWAHAPNQAFATDAYSWTMAGPLGDTISPEMLKRLSERMLEESLTKITLPVPDGTVRTVTLCDFSNPESQVVKNIRQGFHPMGSVEWTAGVILALQKNAVRFWNTGDRKAASFYKAIAQILSGETKKCFYRLDNTYMTFYATGQGVCVGPFGSISGVSIEGWKTPFFYVKSKDNQVLIKGGSCVGAWIILPHLGFNPFILNDRYHETYGKIPLTQETTDQAKIFVDKIASKRFFTEGVIREAPSPDSQIVEPALFNEKMWDALEKGYAQRTRGDYVKAEIYFQKAAFWAHKVVDNSAWCQRARADNAQKEKEIGGIVSYPWGAVYRDNDHPLHYAVLRYPLLNEVAAAMWALATVNFELGHPEETKYWIRRIIDEVSLHQIADIKKDGQQEAPDLIQGYWNALVSWEDNPGGYERDKKIGVLYREVLREKKLSGAKPKTVIVPDFVTRAPGVGDRQ